MDMIRVPSQDGTLIGAHVGGSGPPLLLVHGTTADHSTTWRIVGPMLEQRFTVYRMDRRGRSSSGDADSYSVEREFEYVAAVVETIVSLGEMELQKRAPVLSSELPSTSIELLTRRHPSRDLGERPRALLVCAR
jgi:pimeloyl-ACP methyl ester carboxylesterase